MIIARDVHLQQKHRTEAQDEGQSVGAGTLVLRVFDRPDGGFSIHHVDAQRCSIGASPTCTVQLEGKNVRPVHCVILRGRNRSVVRRWSPNTWLNGKFFNDSVLHEGDELTLGGTRVQIAKDDRPWHDLDTLDDELAPLPFDEASLQGLPPWQKTAGDTDLELQSRVRAAEQRIAQLTRRLIQSQSKWLHLSDQLAQQETPVRHSQNTVLSDAAQNQSGGEDEIAALIAEHDQQRQQWELEREQLLAELARNADRAPTPSEKLEWECPQPNYDADAPVLTSNSEIDEEVAEVSSIVGFDSDDWAHARAEMDRRLADLDDQKASLEARSAELQTRSQELETRIQELQSGAAELDARQASLSERATELDDREASLEEWSRQLDEFRIDLDRRAAEYERRAAADAASIKQLESSRASMEAEVNQRLAAFAEAEAVWQQKEQTWSQQSDEFEQTIADLKEAQEIAAQQPPRVDTEAVEELNRQIAVLEQQVAEASSQAELTRIEMGDAGQFELQIEQERNAWEIERMSLSNQIESLQAEVLETQKRVAELEDASGTTKSPSGESEENHATAAAITDGNDGSEVNPSVMFEPPAEAATSDVGYHQVHADQFEQFTITGGASQTDQGVEPPAESPYAMEHFLDPHQEVQTQSGEHVEEPSEEQIEASTEEQNADAEQAFNEDPMAVEIVPTDPAEAELPWATDAEAPQPHAEDALVASDKVDDPVTTDHSHESSTEDSETGLDDDFWGFSDNATPEVEAEPTVPSEPGVAPDSSQGDAWAAQIPDEDPGTKDARAELPRSMNATAEADMLARLRELVDEALEPESTRDQPIVDDHPVSDWDRPAATIEDASDWFEPSETADAHATVEEADFAGAGGSSSIDDHVDEDDGSDWFESIEPTVERESESSESEDPGDAEASPVSFLEQYGAAHPDTFEEQESPPEPETIGEASLAGAQPEPTGEDSIEDYMQQLLQRVGQGDAKQPLETAAPEPKPVVAEQEPPAKKKPERRSKPDPIANLEAMRELANASARNAISQHDVHRHEASAWTNLGITVAAVLVGAILIVFGRFRMSVLSGLGAAVEVAAIYFGFRSFSNGALAILSRLGKKKPTGQHTSEQDSAVRVHDEDETAVSTDATVPQPMKEESTEVPGDSRDDVTLRDIADSVDSSLFEQVANASSEKSKASDEASEEEGARG